MLAYEIDHAIKVKANKPKLKRYKLFKRNARKCGYNC